MHQQPEFTSREQLYDYYDDYASTRRKNLDKRELEAGKNLLKSYVLETSHQSGVRDLIAALSTSKSFQLAQQTDDLFHLSGPRGELGYVEPLGNRYFVLHTQRENETADRTVQRLTDQSPLLDSLWLAGDAFRTLLDEWIVPTTPYRYVQLKAEFEPRFELGQSLDVWYTDDEDAEQQESSASETERTAVRPPPPQFSALFRRARRLSETYNDYQGIDPSWRAVKMLRVPSTAYGGFDLYSWGKMTHRSPDFREGVSKLRFVTGLYERVTAAIEEAVWLHAEPVRLSDGVHRRFRGLPIVIRFRAELAPSTFNRFIEVTFDQGRGPFRLWGNPIRLGEGKVHVYGLDLHMWQQVYMELTTRHFLFVLPSGTCGNTVHRLMTNVQRFLDPAVTLQIGETSYAGMVRNALLGREVLNA
jgi:hypothetical protein